MVHYQRRCCARCLRNNPGVVKGVNINYQQNQEEAVQTYCLNGLFLIFFKITVTSYAGPAVVDLVVLSNFTSSGYRPGMRFRGTGVSSKLNNAIPLLNNAILRKEVIQPHLPIRLPCYDFVPLAPHTFGGWLLAVTPPTSGADNSSDVTGGVYKARERIHRSLADLRLLAIPASRRRVAACDPN